MPAPRLARATAPCLLVVALAACQGQAPAPTIVPQVTRPPIAPIVQIDDAWTAIGGHWTFTGYVDPEGYPTDVTLQTGEGTTDAMQVDEQVPVAQSVTTAGPLTVTTSQVRKVDQVCVRFHATSQIGSSDSQPLCFPYNPPTPEPPVAPTVEIDPTFTAAGGSWTFGVSLDSGNVPADVVLQVGHGPASKPVYTGTVEVEQAAIGSSHLSFTTKDIPEVTTVCVRFVVTNSVGKAASDPLCFPRSASS